MKCGIEICEGLEKAHKSGVVHRDLKPANIMLTKGGAKLMDFGLAKPTFAAGAPSSGLTQTLTSPRTPLTTEGMVVGTFQYMSPEQVEGKEADARSDIFALGAVLYEMATGKRALLRARPRHPRSLLYWHPIRRRFHRCSLFPQRRWKVRCEAAWPRILRSACKQSTTSRQLKWAHENASSPRLPVAAHKRFDRMGWLVAAVLMLALLGAAAWWLRARETTSAMYFNSSVPFTAAHVALSPDGRMLALVAYSDQANKNVIWLQQVGGRGATVLSGTVGASYPFWAQNSRSIGFFADGKLKTINVASARSAQVLADAPFGRGGAWSKNGVILFTPDAWSGLYRVPSSGGIPVQVTKADSSQFQVSNRWPVFLPDGQHFSTSLAISPESWRRTGSCWDPSTQTKGGPS